VSDTPESIGQLMRRGYHLNRVAGGGALRRHGVTVSQFGVLRRLADAPGSSGADLARDMFMTPQAVQELLGGLESAGLLARRADRARRRIRRATLTPLGERLLAACLPEARSVEQRLLRSFTDDERRELVRLLQKYVDAGAGLDDEERGRLGA
jgi:DNA-binding MarR family transcriptional regulator